LNSFLGLKWGSGLVDKKAGTVNHGREVSRNARTELRIRNHDVRIGQNNSHGHDPRNIKG